MLWTDGSIAASLTVLCCSQNNVLILIFPVSRSLSMDVGTIVCAVLFRSVASIGGHCPSVADWLPLWRINYSLTRSPMFTNGTNTVVSTYRRFAYGVSHAWPTSARGMGWLITDLVNGMLVPLETSPVLLAHTGVSINVTPSNLNHIAPTAVVATALIKSRRLINEGQNPRLPTKLP